MKRRVFTIIELLVVISIIVLLTSLLLPALSRAKGVAVKIQCANKMKQIGTQVFVYCDDFKGSHPANGNKYRIPIAALNVYWINYINYYYFNDVLWHTVANPSINFVCPSDLLPYSYQGLVNSYGFNSAIMSGMPARAIMRIQDLLKPSETYMITDSNWTSRWAFGPGGTLVYIRLEHNKSTSMFYADGHISSIKEQPPVPSSDVPWCNP